MTTIFSLLFLKINVRLFSQSLTDGLVQFYRNFIYVTLSIKLYILNTLSVWWECSFHFLLSHCFTSGLLKCYILLKFYPETVDENIFLDQLNRYSLLMENEARIRQRYRRHPKRTSQAPSKCIQSSAMMGAFLGARIVATTLILCTAAFLAEGKTRTIPCLWVYFRIQWRNRLELLEIFKGWGGDIKTVFSSR